MGNLRLLLIILPLILFAVILAPVLWLGEILKIKSVRKLTMYWHRTALWLIGVRVRVHGKFSET